jgi:hypothetical protein
MTATIHELYPIDASRAPQGRLAQINREIAKLEELGWNVSDEIQRLEQELLVLRMNAKQILDTYRMALDERDGVYKRVKRNNSPDAA